MIDTVISRMLKLLASVLVLGFVICGIQAAGMNDWAACQQYLWSGLGGATAFTLLWVITAYNIRGRKRADDANNVVGLPIAVLALFATLGFVAAAVAAAFGQQFGYGLALMWGGVAAGWGLSLVWCITDYNCTT